ncbi:MAG: heme transporter ATP-binding protein CcmA [Gammaproteobacteria bacterium]|nr:heme transporter ATP-binding protein CcmA [Gammaproteobacteria bacterium]
MKVNFMLRIKQLSCSRNDRCLFSNLDIVVNPGEILHLKGKNGAGKSSLLQILAGLLLPETGEVFWQDKLIAIQTHYARELFYLGHKSGVKAGLTVAENLQLSAMLMGKNKVSDMLQLLSFFKLEKWINSPSHLLSAGQKQRIALTRLLITDATLWLLDEPFNAIDQESIQLLMHLLQQHVEKGGIVVLTSHQSLAFAGLKEKQWLLSSNSLGETE